MSVQSPFDYLKTINDTKRDVMTTSEDEEVYNPFLINRTLSYFSDTVGMANEMNMFPHLDNRLQYGFLINIIRKRKRFSPWMKPSEEEDVNAVKEFYGCNNERAREFMSILTKEQIEILKKKVDKGGRKKGNSNGMDSGNDAGSDPERTR